MDVEEMLDRIDACVFSGDTFTTDARLLALLEKYVNRWHRQIPQLREELEEWLSEDDDV